MGSSRLRAGESVRLHRLSDQLERTDNPFATLRSTTMAAVDEYLSLPVTEACWATAKAWQGLLVRDGHRGGPGVADLLIAATAVQHNACVLHYDADFEATVSVESRFHHQWAVPRGSVP